jgi:hypothetical protein
MLVNTVIEFSGICPRSNVKEEFDFRLMGLRPLKKFLAFNFCNELFILEVGNFIVPGKIIHEDQISESFFIQELHKTAANKTSGAGHYDGRTFLHEHYL